MIETLTLYISGMVCGGCASNVEKALLALDGVAEAEVSHVEGRAEVSYDPAKVQPAAIKAAIEVIGYAVR